MDYVLQFMKENDVPLTRENYLEIAFMGNPPDDAETESDLPEGLEDSDGE